MSHLSMTSGEPVSSLLLLSLRSPGLSSGALLPGRLRNTGDLAAQRELPETQAAQAKLA